MKPSEYIAAVAEDLQTNGWAQHMMYTATGACLYGAMANVTMKNLGVMVFEHRTDPAVSVPQTAQRFVLAGLKAKGFESIPVWNDTPGRTLNEVLDFLHECQIGLKEKEC